MRVSARVPARRATGRASGGGTGGSGAAGRSAGPGGTTVRAAAAIEFALTGGVLFVLVTTVRWVMASPLGRALPEPHL